MLMLMLCYCHTPSPSSHRSIGIALCRLHTERASNQNGDAHISQRISFALKGHQVQSNAQIKEVFALISIDLFILCCSQSLFSVRFVSVAHVHTLWVLLCCRWFELSTDLKIDANEPIKSDMETQQANAEAPPPASTAITLSSDQPDDKNRSHSKVDGKKRAGKLQ